jgi:hypothetical protein
MFFPGFVESIMEKRAVLPPVQRNLPPSASRQMSKVCVKIM